MVDIEGRDIKMNVFESVILPDHPLSRKIKVEIDGKEIRYVSGLIIDNRAQALQKKESE